MRGLVVMMAWKSWHTSAATATSLCTRTPGGLGVGPAVGRQKKKERRGEGMVYGLGEEAKDKVPQLMWQSLHPCLSCKVAFISTGCAEKKI
jgi:hypothetical protein